MKKFLEKRIVKIFNVYINPLIIGGLFSAMGNWDYKNDNYFYIKLSMLVILIGVYVYSSLQYYKLEQTKDDKIKYLNALLNKEKNDRINEEKEWLMQRKVLDTEIKSYDRGTRELTTLFVDSSNSINQIAKQILEGKRTLDIWNFKKVATGICSGIYNLLCEICQPYDDFTVNIMLADITATGSKRNITMIAHKGKYEKYPGKFGLPEMGAAGAAVGTVLAGIVNLLILIGFILHQRIPFVLEFSKHFRWTKESLQNYLIKCFPIICNEVLIGVGNMMINVVLGRQSEQAIAAVAVFRTMEGLVIAFFSGFSNAASILVGKEVGAGNHELAFERAKRLVYLCSAIISIACLTLLLVHNPLLHTLGLSGKSYKIGTGMLIIYSIAAIIRMGNWAQNDTYRSAGDAAFGSIMEITFMYLMVLPFVYLSNFYFHAPFLLVFAFCYIDEPIRYIIMQCHLYSGKWIRPVSDAGLATIDEFRKQHHIEVKSQNQSHNKS